MKKKKKTTKWIIFARVLLILQIIASVMIFAVAVKTKMLPTKYILLVAVGLLIMELLVFALVHLGQNRKNQRHRDILSEDWELLYQFWLSYAVCMAHLCLAR